MTILFDGQINVHYGFLFLRPEDEEGPDLVASRRGQRNGLCGSAQPGGLSMVTGLHTGQVPVVIEALDHEPAVDQTWDEIVEVSVQFTETDLVLAAFQEFIAVHLPAVGWYRARWHANGMDEAHAHSRAVDRYLRQLWPAPSTPDRVIRQTSENAAYWHSAAQGDA